MLSYGLISAAVLRAIMILGGAALIENFHPVLLVRPADELSIVPAAAARATLQWTFGRPVLLHSRQSIGNACVPMQGFAGILLFSSYKLLAADDEEEDEDLTDNFIVTFCR